MIAVCILTGGKVQIILSSTSRNSPVRALSKCWRHDQSSFVVSAGIRIVRLPELVSKRSISAAW